MATKPVSNIAVAFAAQSASLGIPKPRSDEVLHAPDASKHHPTMLPTPPNSISPTLPPHKHNSGSSRPSHADSDIDLQDAVEHAAAQDQPTALSRAALSGLEAAGAITPAMLAKHHLPDILLAHGPMAIRHVLNHLAQSVPGFSRIPPAKARRLVVAALEIRGGGGVSGDVEFEKVGWGRWDARMKGQPLRDGRSAHLGSVPILGTSHSALSPPASVPDSYAMSNASGLQIPRAGRYKRDPYSGSWAGDSTLSSRDEEMVDMNMAEHEADKMSLDGSEAGSDSSEMAEDIPGLEDDLDDVTDHEDWAAIGPEALRQGSLSFKPRYTHRDYNYLSRASAVRKRQTSLQYSRPGRTPTPAISSSLASRMDAGKFAASSLGNKFGVTEQDPQEAAAIQALLALGSM